MNKTMKIKKSRTKKQACCFRPGLDFAGFRFRNVGFLKPALIALAIAFTANTQPALTSAEADDPQLVQFANRVGELVRQLGGGARPGGAPKEALVVQNAAVQQLIKQAGDDVEVHLRPGNHTVMQLRGRSLHRSVKGSNLDGAIARVEFYDGSTKLGQVAAAPYTFVWQDVSAGNHLLSARAIDRLGAETDSTR